jgi:alkanesulfonate monooxygenase SsuD/methylene tetrahydromethanopterin reductase-like flavin-dependent oxidoreductase (luciferase family)
MSPGPGETAPSSGVTFGIYPAPIAAPFEELVARARRAEAMGFDALWTADETAMAYPGIITLEAWSLLGALARETSRVRLGTLVSPVTLRHPLVLAMCVSTVDHASNGRVTVGMGVGGLEVDLASVGEEALRPRDLVDRLEDQLVIVDALLRGERVTRIDGPHRMRDAVVEPPVQRPRPPILVAAQGPRTLRLAAAHGDIWNTLGGQPLEGDRISLDEAVAITRRDVETIDAACAELGRDPTTLRRSAFAWRAGAYASPDAFGEWVGRYRELGFSEFMLWWPSPHAKDFERQETVLEHIAADVIPQLRKS